MMLNLVVKRQNVPSKFNQQVPISGNTTNKRKQPAETVKHGKFEKDVLASLKSKILFPCIVIRASFTNKMFYQFYICSDTLDRRQKIPKLLNVSCLTRRMKFVVKKKSMDCQVVVALQASKT